MINFQTKSRIVARWCSGQASGALNPWTTVRILMNLLHSSKFRAGLFSKNTILVQIKF